MKKLNRKGFTLIELLAVIVILALILTLAVPAVLNIISDSNKDTAKIAAESYLNSVRMCISAEAENPTTCANNDTIKKYYDGTIENGTSVTIDGEGKITNLVFVHKRTGYTVSVTPDSGGSITNEDIDAATPVETTEE